MLERLQQLSHGIASSPFDRIRSVDADGNEYWSARDLAKTLGYTEYGKFRNAIKRAEVACEGSGNVVSHHFAHVSDMIQVGKGAMRRVQDVRLSRYACYLIVQNADPSKEIVAQGQAYFARQTRRQELADEAATLNYGDMSEDQRRLYTRQQVKQHNKELSKTARNAGVITSQDFAAFHSSGYEGLYDGRRVGDIRALKRLGPKQDILDYMGSTELVANLFRITQTDEKLKRKPVRDKHYASRTHYEVGAEVRRAIERIGGVMPEDLPTPQEGITELERKQKQIAKRKVPSLPAPKSSGLKD